MATPKQEADDQDQPKLARFCQLRAHVGCRSCVMDISAPSVNSPMPTISMAVAEHEREHQPRIDRHEGQTQNGDDDRHGEDGGGGLLHFFVDGILNRQMVRSFSRNFRQHAARLIAFRSPEGAAATAIRLCTPT